MSLSNILLIPGVGGSSPLSELKNLLFKQGQAGGIWVPSLSPAMISSESFGTGVQTFLDLSGNGKNATQASSGSRPAWGRVPKSGRRNLLERTEDLTQTAWTKAGTTATAQTVTETETTGTHEIRQQIPNSPAIGIVYTFSAIVSLSARTTFRMVFGGTAFGTDRGADFNLADNTFSLTGSTIGMSASISPMPNGKHFLSIRVPAGVSGGQVFARFFFTDGAGVTSFAGDSASSATLEEIQVEIGSTATAYQRVTTAFDVTESGQRDCYYLQPDGVDDGMATASIDFSGTDKMTVFAAVRKLSDATRGTLVETGTDWTSVNGSFAIEAPGLDANQGYRFASRGTTARNNNVTTGYAAPVTNILTMQSDISTPIIKSRINGVNLTDVSLSQGTGNYDNLPFYLFRRGGTVLPFNGQCFGLIVAGGSYPLSTIQEVERILSGYTPGVSL
jgi:hypothetical protein